MIYLLLAVGIGSAQNAPIPFGALPSERVLRWHEMELYGLVHFGLNTFQGKEWGYGDADPKIFDPKLFDAEQIVLAAKAGGLKGLILVAKHHDGFALWPTTTTDYNISKSPWRNGKGDMVREFQKATAKHGLKFGIYCSPWDRNHKDYGTPEYLKAYREQLRELYTNYGDLFISWHDGANGGDGYYGGAREKRNIDHTTYYDWETTWAMTRRLQPNAVIFSDIGPDVRWVGNEKGFAGETSWATFTPTAPDGIGKPAPGFSNYKDSPVGTRNGKFWIPAECDVPLRPGWFYHSKEDTEVRTPDQLFDLYFKCVGRGANLDLGLAPDKRGLMHDADVRSLREFGEMLNRTFAVNFAKGATVRASNIRARNARSFGPLHLLDSDRYSYWATDDGATTAEVTFEFASDRTFSIIRLRENIKLGQRIESFAVDAWQNRGWKEVAKGTSIGANRLVRLPAKVETRRVRLRITRSAVSIALSEFGLFAEPN
ncbi:MAG: alpha-L-fucosidase [Pyrinomonadaceae bacterium]